jgi:hypothetical protein
MPQFDSWPTGLVKIFDASTWHGRFENHAYLNEMLPYRFGENFEFVVAPGFVVLNVDRQPVLLEISLSQTDA